MSDGHGRTAPDATSRIVDWHAHVYFDAATRDAAWTLRQAIAEALAERVGLGRFHEKPVGPHPLWSYQLSIATADFAGVVAWLVLHRGALDVFIHPNTGDELGDHRDRALWIGRSHDLDLSRFVDGPAARMVPAGPTSE